MSKRGVGGPNLFRGKHVLKVCIVLIAIALVQGCGSSEPGSTVSLGSGGTYAPEEPTPMTSAEADVAACKAHRLVTRLSVTTATSWNVWTTQTAATR